jgi:hypothetical protein
MTEYSPSVRHDAVTLMRRGVANGDVAELLGVPFFTNKSDDIRKLCSDTLTEVGVEWTTLARGSDPFNISVARRCSVALMDAHVGPKY